jgi:hypothetical protein
MLKLGLYKHFKGTTYQVYGVAKHSEDLSEQVVYGNPQKENDLWVRPLAMFQETVIHEGKEVKRFQFISE